MVTLVVFSPFKSTIGVYLGFHTTTLTKPLDITIIDKIGPRRATLVKVELELGFEITFSLYNHVRNPGDLVTKARIYDEAVEKTGSVTALKLIHICVDYSAKMETILAEIRALFDARNRFFRGSPIPLEKVPDLLEFLDLPPTEVLQNLQTPPTLRTNQESAESRERPAPESDARTYEVGKAQLEVRAPALDPTPTLEAQDPVPIDTS